MYLKFCCLSLLVLGLASCDKEDCFEGSGPLTTREIVTDDFDGVRLEGSMDVEILQGPELKVEAIGNANIIDKLSLDVNGNILDIEMENGCYRDFELSVRVTMPVLRFAAIDGSGDIRIRDFENGDGILSLEIEGSGDIRTERIEGTQSLEVDIEGSGEFKGLEAFPQLVDLEVSIQGSGDYDAFEIAAQHAVVDIEGSGDVRLTATETLDVDIAGSGDVYYRGNPVITLDVDGSGDLIDAN